ncbi:MAG: hypothetical protein KBS59_06095 [Clostridiales bacterium]|nr:hypothetical protein [Clostridiales bacterium]
MKNSINEINMPRLYDMHSHILPEMDDGSKSADQTLQMLNGANSQGVCAIVATPHFYAEKQTPDEFLARRGEAVQKLKAMSPLPVPVYLGAEVLYFFGMGSCAELDKLCIAGTKYLLVEMPFSKWTGEVISDIADIKSKLGIIPIIAHIERYERLYSRDMLERLVSAGAVIQSNAEFFTGKTRRKALKMLDMGYVNLLGSDCHNTTSRPENIALGAREIYDHDEYALEKINSMCRFLLAKAEHLQ